MPSRHRSASGMAAASILIAARARASASPPPPKSRTPADNPARSRRTAIALCKTQMKVRQHQEEAGQNKMEDGWQDPLKPRYMAEERQPADEPEQHECEIRRS